MGKLAKEIMNRFHDDNAAGPLSAQIGRLRDIEGRIQGTLDGVDGADEMRATLWRFHQELDGIQERLADTSFYAGIVGEFSSGKSTFINAFLEAECLAADFQQGTTCAVTVIRHSERENVVVTRRDGGRTWMVDERNTLPPAEIRRMCPDFLEQQAADETRGREIDEVLWLTPAAPLKDGLVIVDTPGIGSINPRHTEVAREAAERRCDAILVLTSLHQPLSSDLLTFVKKIAGEHAENCVFVGTFKDQLKDRELERMRSFFDGRLKGAFGHPRPVRFVSAYAALQDLQKRQDGASGPTPALDEFRSFRADMLELLMRSRQRIQAGRISALLSQLSGDLEERLAASDRQLQDKIAEIRKKIRECCF